MSDGTYAKEDLRGLAAMVTTELKRKVQEGEATASDLNVAINLLRHNGILATAKDTSSLIDELEEQDLLEELPPPADGYRQ
jgi:hypothetical protein